MSDLKESIAKQDEQKAQIQQKLAAQEELNMKLENSQIESNLAMAEERRGRIRSDMALAEERISEAHENNAQAVLARAKTITEISKMQDDRILAVLEFINNLTVQEEAKQAGIESRVEDSSRSVISETKQSSPSSGGGA
jgi:hypothetical protein